MNLQAPNPVMLSGAKHLWLFTESGKTDLRFFAPLRMTTLRVQYEITLGETWSY
jgi:hypothetical protein